MVATTTAQSTHRAVIAPYRPLEWQLAPLMDKSPVLLLTGSMGGGKSRVAAEKINAYCWHYPGATGVIGRKAREWCSHSTVPFVRHTVQGDDIRIKLNVSDGTFYYPNGSVIYSFGMMDEKQRQSMRSIGGDGGIDIAWLEEANAFTRQDYEEVLGRLRHTAAPWQQLMLSTNPGSPTHWIYTDLILGKNAAVYYSAALDNPYNSPRYKALLDRMTGVMRARLVDGKWVQAEGAIYDEFDPETHIVDADAVPELVRRWRVIDFGYSNPFVCQWWGMSADGDLYRYREIYVTHKLVEDLTKQIIALTGDEVIEATVADHDAEDRATMERHGISTVTANKDVSPGIQAVQLRMRVDPVKKKPRLFFVRNALVKVDSALEDSKKPTCTEEEVSGYVWMTYPDGKPNKEQPLKVNDHGCDATRYLVVYVDGATAPEDLIGWAG